MCVCGIGRPAILPVSAPENAPFALYHGLLSCRVAEGGPFARQMRISEARKSESSPEHAVARSNSPYPAMDRLRADLMVDV